MQKERCTVIHLFLDDLRPCPKGFVLARNAEECILLLQECDVDILSLDHNLGWGSPTGYDVAKWIVREQKYPRQIYLHTSNPVGRQNMFQLLYHYKPEGVRVHNGPMPSEVLRRIEAQP
jgi:hypothetical protein